MCGIAGWIGFREKTAPPLRLELLAHRGPDDRGEERYVSASRRFAASLGSTRLAILDLSSAGHMPMNHPEEPLALVYNGEIYNFQELRRELEARGERFRSRTDTEVILRAYRVWGDGVVGRLRGMFAFALWDGRGDGRLLLARDPFGKKPLYYHHDEGQGLAFASELKSLLSAQRPSHLDLEGLEYYLDRGYPPPDRCLLQGLRKVLPAHFLVWEKGRLTGERYWQIPEPLPNGTGMSLKEAGVLLRETLMDATRRRLVADVPVGLLLSGGADSSSLLALMARLSPEPVRTYTACFGGSGLDESESARQTALHFGTRHHALLINPRCGELLPFVASQMDEPIADPSALATYLICRRARQEVTVLLSGDGSDELLLGYPRYRLHALAQTMSHLMPVAARQALGRYLPPRSLLERVFSAPGTPLLRDRYWLDHGPRRRGAFSREEGRTGAWDAVQQVLQEDIISWLVENILVKLDKMSMAASVEIRAPFLDQRVANLVLSLPVRTRLSFRQGKRVLSEAMRGLVPGHISWFRKKPFHLPINDWLRCEWRPLVQDVLLDARTRERGWVEPQEVRRLIKEQMAGPASHGRRLYQLLVLELWARAILDRGEAEPQPESVAACARELSPSRPLRRVAVVAPAGIGDTLCLTPGIRELGRTDPNLSLTLYVDRVRGADQVLAGVAPVDRQVPVNFAEPGVGKVIPLLRDLYRTPPDALISTLISRSSWLLGIFSGVNDRRSWVPQWSWSMRWGRLFWRRPLPYHPEPRDVGRQDALTFCELLGVEAPASLQPFMASPLWQEGALWRARAKLARLPRPILAVNAAAHPSLPQRQYPLQKLGQALGELLSLGAIGSVALLGDRYSRAAHGSIRTLLGVRGLDLAGELSLAASAAVMADCDAVLTIDGGLLHVALATSLPVVALYGPTEIFSTDPRDLPGRYASLSAFPSCRCECLPHRGIRVGPQCQGQAQCLASLEPGEIVAAVTALLAEGQAAAAGGRKQL